MKKTMIFAILALVTFHSNAQLFDGINKELHRIQSDNSARLDAQIRAAKIQQLNWQREDAERKKKMDDMLKSTNEMLNYMKKQQDWIKKQKELLNPLTTFGNIPFQQRELTPEEQFMNTCYWGVWYLTSQNDTNRAMEYFNKAINMSNNIYVYQKSDGRLDHYLSVRYYRGIVNKVRGNIDQAIEDLEVVSQLGTKQEDYVQYAILTLMDLLKEKGDFSGVVKKHHTLLSYPKAQENFRYQIFMADTYLRLNDIESACEHIDRAINYDRDSAWLYTNYYCEKNNALLDSIQIDMLLKCLAEKFAEKDYVLGTDELNLALVNLEIAGRNEEIINLYNRQCPFYSDYPPLLLEATYSFLSIGEWGKVIDLYNVLVDVFKHDTITYGQYYGFTVTDNEVHNLYHYANVSNAMVLLNNKDYFGAYDILKAIPDSILGADLLGFSASMNIAVDDNYNRALELYNILVDIEPSADAYSGRAMCYRKTGHLEDALNDYQKVIELELDSVTWNTPYAYYYLGEKHIAKKIAKNLLSSDSLSFLDYYEASLFYDETMGRERKAYLLLKKALKEEHDKSIYPLVVLSFDTPSLRKKVEKLLNEQ